MTTHSSDGKGDLSKDREKLVALLLEEQSRAAQKIRPYARGDRTRAHRAPPSFAQQRLWFIDQLQVGAAGYWIPIAWRLRGQLDENALHQSLNTVLQRHEVLRTNFVSIEGDVQQEIAPEGAFSLGVVDLTDKDAKEREELITRHKVDDASAAFNLRAGPLIRGRLLRLGIDDHLLLLTVHHIISDGWSIEILVQELAQLYAAHRDGRKDPLKPLPIQYADYAHWQRQWLQGGRLEAQLRYWRSRLNGAPPLIDLPKDRPRPAAQSYRGGNLKVALDRDLTARLKAFAKKHEATLFMVLYGAWSILLSRLSGQEDIVIGTPVTNRQRPELEGLIGCFVNMLPLRVDICGDLSVSKLIEQIREITLGAYDHQDAPFEKIVEALQVKRTLNRNPLFQVTLSLESTPRNMPEWPGLLVTPEEGVHESALFDLMLSLEERNGEIVGTLKYSAELFDASTLERWMACFTVLMRGMTNEPRTPISELPILPDCQRDQVISQFNTTEILAYPPQKVIQELFEEQAERSPQAVAVMYERQSLTYAGLNDRANRLARYLRSKGVGPDELVGLCVERSLEMVIGMLGILKAGGAYLPLDPAYPPERLAFILEDATAKVLLIQESLRRQFETLKAEVVALDGDWDQIGQQAADNLDVRTIGLRSHHLAYVIYTSGLTGKPKGVMVEHANVVRLFTSTAHWFNFSERDVWTLFHSFAFDFSVWELWGALLYGGRVVIVPYLTARSPQDFYRLLCDEGVTVLNQTPSAFGQLVDAQVQSGSRQQSLRVVIFGGEALDFQRLQPWVERNGVEKPQLVNMYGITETTVHVTYRLLSRKEIEVERGSVVGKPIPDLRAYILDRYGQPVAIGVVGEIYVGGVGVSRGYLNRPGLTVERFVPDPFNTTDPNGRMYMTGDLGRWRADGSIEYLGRDDHQVKIRGFRIELGEIETQLVGHELVKEAVVLAREDIPGEKRLVAYVIPKDQSVDRKAALPAVLRPHLYVSLPDYMVPSDIVVLEHFPLTQNGKLDRAALPVPELSAHVSGYSEDPQDEAEHRLAGIWRDLLRVDRIGGNDNFFELGGHSFLALRLLMKVNQSFGSNLCVADVYKSPTLRELADRIRGEVPADEFVDLSREAYLPDEIRPTQGMRRTQARTVLLTGGTGFVGRFLLAQLLEDSNETIHCLVRAPTRAKAASRLKAILEDWDLWRADFEGRLVPVLGDLSLPRLGLDDLRYKSLADAVDTIYHCATRMNHLETYSAVKRTNVAALRDLLKFTLDGPPKLINYISTLSVFGESSVKQDRVVDERSPIEHERHPHSNGYAASKWVAEKMLMIARKRGISCNIFRLGLVWADTQQGRYDELQREYRLLKTCLLTGYGIKNYRFDMPPTPVDYVARAVAFLGSRHDQGQGTFHISSSGEMKQGLFEQCNKIAATSLELKSWAEWIAEMRRLSLEGKTLPIAPLIEADLSKDLDSSFANRGNNDSGQTTFDCAETHRVLEQAGIVAPTFDEDLLQVHLRGIFLRDRELRQPSEEAASNVR